MTVFLILCAAAAILLGIGWVFFLYIFTRKGIAMPGKTRVTEDSPDLRAWKNYHPRHDEDVEWFCRQEMEEVWISSFDGLRLYGQYLPCEKPERLVICVHGYRGGAKHDFADQGRWLHSEHCALLFITQRGSGKSEGNYVTFGAKEKQDVRSWAGSAAERFPDLPIYLYGISMGATTVLLSSVTGLSDRVKGIIADCGFTSVRDILSVQCRQAFHLPAVPLRWVLEFFCTVFAGFRFSEADAKRVLPDNRIPVLFIHGANDHFVLPENSRENHAACGAPNELVLIDNGVHASSYCENPGLYEAAVRRLFRGEIG